MDVDETQKIDDLNVADQVKNKNGHDNDQVFISIFIF